MIGNNEFSGIMPLAIIDLLNRFREKKNKSTCLKVSFIEIYNENIKDLLISEGTFEIIKIKILISGKTQKKELQFLESLKLPSQI